MFETQKSRNKTSSGDIGLNIRTLSNRPSGSFMVDMGISSNIKSPFPKCYMTFWDMTKYNDTLN